MEKSRTIMFTSVGIFIAITAVAIIFVNFVGVSMTIGANMVFGGIMILTLPYSIFKFFEFKRIKGYEREFPGFLRDLAESQRAGLTLLQAIQSVAKSEYGILTNEIKRLDKQISWNVPFEKALKSFSDRMKYSKLIVRSVTIIDQANKSGGNIEETMEALADNIESLKELEEEKSALLNQEVLMMYAIFFIFLGITIALIKFLVPLLQSQGITSGLGAIGASNNPCSICIDNPDSSCIGCSVIFMVSSSFDFGANDDPSSYYKGLFFLMILIQAVCSGLIAGQISADSVTAGVKHSLLMLFSGFAIFIAVVKLGLA